METEAAKGAALETLVELEFDRLYARLEKKEQDEAARWGGFFRRCSALLVDIFVLCLFSLPLFYLSRVAFLVGLAAHRRSIAWEWQTAEDLLPVVGIAWLFLVCAYFVLLHGMDGRTVGKWLFGLRVVNTHGEPITYTQASIRWIAAVLTVPLVLGFLRILWHREKRGWHDSLARTWVIKE
jgi:uncharacterized RDD family membrane protein YckC